MGGIVANARQRPTRCSFERIQPSLAGLLATGRIGAVLADVKDILGVPVEEAYGTAGIGDIGPDPAAEGATTSRIPRLTSIDPVGLAPGSELPTTEEQEPIWQICLKKHDLDLYQDRPLCHEWTGAEINLCCIKAADLVLPLVEAANYVIPIAKSDPEAIARLRLQANGAWKSASYTGPYRQDVAAKGAKERKIKL